MKDIKLIGLLGTAGSGKTTVAKHLFQKHGFRIFSFSKPIKEMAMDYFGVSYFEAYETKPQHVRTILQGIGSLVREELGDYILNEMLLRIKYSDADKIVIDDVRLKEEVEFIKELGGIVIKVETSNAFYCPDNPSELTESQKQHITEQIDAIPYDYLISAEYGNLAKLEEGIDAEINRLEEQVRHEKQTD